MLLKRLEIHGFKSFARKSVFEFDPGMTAVVGPNGSGKSNVADALRWVLGEQHSRSLRTKKMEDVIFTGSGARGAMSVAEVTVVFDNADGRIALDSPEVAVSRRLYRSGESEYLVNQRRVRLRDLHELLSRANAGQGAYSIVGQGMIDQILSLRPEERRGLIEEAADIRRHYEKIGETKHRLDQTEANLARVRDLVTELGPRVGRLRSQAERAKSAEVVHTEFGEALGRWYAHQVAGARSALAGATAGHTTATADLETARAERDQLREAAGTMEGTLAAATAEAARQEQELEAARRDLARLEQEHALAGERLAAASRDLERLDGEVSALAPDLERARSAAQAAEAAVAEAGTASAARTEAEEHAQAQLARVERELGALRKSAAETAARRAEHEAARQQFEARLGLARQQVADLEARIDAGSGQAAGLAEARERAQAELVAAQERLDGVGQRRAVAEEHLRQAEGEVRESERGARESALEVQLARREHGQLEERLAALQKPSGQSRQKALTGLAPLVRSLTIEPAWEGPLARALGAALDAPGADRGLVTALDAGQAGAVVVPVGDAEVPDGRGVIGLASGVAKASSPAAASVLRRILLVEDVDAGLEEVGRFAGVVVTRQGIVLEPTGVVRTGPVEQAASQALALERNRRNLESDLSALAARIAELEAAAAGREQALVAARAEASRGQEGLRLVQDEQRTARQQVERAGQQAARARQDHEFAQRVQADLQRQLAGAREQQQELVGRLARLEAPDLPDTASLEADISAAEAGREAAFGAWAEARTGAAEARGEVARARDAAEAAKREVGRLENLLQARMAERSRLQATVDGGGEAAQALSVRMAAQEAVVARLAEAAPAARAAADRQADVARQAGARLFAAEQAVFAAERAALQAESALARARERWDALVASLEDDGIEVHALGEPEPADEEELAALERRVRTLRNQVRTLGGYDKDIVTEYEDSAGRLEHLQTQAADLERARESLLAVIDELRSHSEERFAIAFDAVAQQFQRYFTQFFGGGAARLILTNPADLSATGIEIEAQPPGKRFRSLSLLSGGERALTAAALLFAVIHSNPSPFCVLDEVDAALDEANVGRFADALRELAAETQFIVVTHNRNTIDRADGVYGLTMGGDGISRVVSIRLRMAMDQEPLAAIA